MSSLFSNTRKSKDILSEIHSLPPVYDTSDATATPSTMLEGETGLVDDETVVGTIPIRDESDVSVSGPTVTFAAGYHDNTPGTVPGVEIATPVLSINNSTGTVTATVEQEAGYIIAGEKTSAIMTIDTQGAKTVTPSSNDIVAVNAGKVVSGNITMAGSSTLLPENILRGTTIFGVEGTMRTKAPNGTEWTELVNDNIRYIDIIDDTIYAATYPSNNVRLCKLCYSRDGISWTVLDLEGDILYNNNVFYLKNSNSIYILKDYIMWVKTSIQYANNLTFNIIGYYNNIFYAYIQSYNYTSGVYRSDDGINWSMVYSNTSINYVISYLCCNDGMLHIIHGNNICYSVDDGITWNECVYSSDTVMSNLGSIKYHNGKWFIVCRDGFYYSTNGMTWYKSNINISGYYINSICYTTNIIVASISGYGLWYSTDDGITWNQSNYTTKSYDRLFYNNGIWHAGSQNMQYDIHYSIDGINWNQCIGSSDRLTEIKYVNNVFISFDSTAEQPKYSTDGITWIEVGNIDVLMYNSMYKKQVVQDILFINNIWFAFSNTYMMYSHDLISWNICNEVIGHEKNKSKLIYFNDKYIYINNSISYSEDYITWNILEGSPCFNYAKYSNGLWVLCSNFGLYYSTDGITWTQSNITTGIFIYVYNANGIWVASSYNSGLWYSMDGINWNRSSITNDIWHYIYYANGIWVALSKNGICYSTDGITWTQNNIVNMYLTKIHNANGIWVGCSNNGLYYSTDGITWTQSNITDNYFDSVYNANGIWVSNGSNGAYYSTDGMLWTQSNYSPSTNLSWFNYSNICYGNGIWVISDNRSYEYTYRYVWYSTDGITWTQSDITSGGNCIIYDNGIWIMVASSNTYYSIDGKYWNSTGNIKVISTNISTINAYYGNGMWIKLANNIIQYSYSF